MNTDWVLWVIRAILIIVGIIVIVMVWKGKKEGKYQKYSFRFFTIGGTAFTLGIILLILSFITTLFWDYGLFLTIVGVISLVIGLAIRNRLEKNR